MKGTAVPNYPEYSGLLYLIARNTAKIRENKHDEKDRCT